MRTWFLLRLPVPLLGFSFNFQREEDEKNIRRRTAVTMAVNTLSYSNSVLFQQF